MSNEGGAVEILVQAGPCCILYILGMGLEQSIRQRMAYYLAFDPAYDSVA